ncbi:hypothetical protein N9W34_01620 [Rickettsiales bacterium]|nr:hypothetical protein [Rickettsiales bacterium]
MSTLVSKSAFSLNSHIERIRSFGLDIIGKQDVDKGRVAFDKDSFDAKMATLQNFLLIYENTKNEVKDLRASEEIKKIKTFHPIGNNTADQGKDFDLLARILAFKQRDEFYGKYGTLTDKAKYTEEHSDKILERFNQEFFGEENKGQFKESFEDLENAIITRFIKGGISKEVISRKEQAEAGALASNYLRSSEEERVIVWNPDMDGDPTANVSEILEFDANQGLSLIQIYDLKDKRDPSKNLYQSRISCEDGGKRGVGDFVHMLNHSEVVSKVTGFSDVIGSDFEGKYAQYKEYLDGLKFEKTSEKEGPDLPVNFALNAIIASTLPAFTDAKGMVLSDFPDESDKASQLLAKLMFTRKAVSRYISEKKQIGLEIDQIYMPLCENKESIENFQQNLEVFNKSVISELSKAKKEGDEEKIQEILDAITSGYDGGHRKFIFGTFSGPSDLTKDMGQSSILEMTKSSVSSELNFRKFKEKVKEIIGEDLYSQHFANVQYAQEYGKGTAHRRGGNYVLGAMPRTIQGLQLASMSRVIQKAYEQGMDMCDMSIDDLEQLQQDIAEYEATFAVTKSSEAHKSFFCEDENSKGVINAQLDDLGKMEIFKPALKNYSNPVGHRGYKEDGKYENKAEKNTRAIGSAAKHAYTGLINNCGFAFNPSEETPDIDLVKMINKPFGLQIFIAELLQMASIDYKRAETLGFEGDAISKTKEYVNNVANFFADKFEIKSPDSLETMQERNDFVNNVLNHVIDKGLIKNETLAKRLALFKEQVPLIAGISASLTAKVEKISKAEEITEEQIANAASLINDIANFQLPVVPALLRTDEQEIDDLSDLSSQFSSRSEGSGKGFSASSDDGSQSDRSSEEDDMRRVNIGAPDFWTKMHEKRQAEAAASSKIRA